MKTKIKRTARFEGYLIVDVGNFHISIQLDLHDFGVGFWLHFNSIRDWVVNIQVLFVYILMWFHKFDDEDNRYERE